MSTHMGCNLDVSVKRFATDITGEFIFDFHRASTSAGTLAPLVGSDRLARVEIGGHVG